MKKNKMSLFFCLGIYIAIAFGLVSSKANACDVPVFRYALERWPADQYRAIVVEVNPFSKTEKEALGKLRKDAQSKGLNLRLQTMKQEAFVKSEYSRKLSEKINTNTLIIFYPKSSRILKPVWKGGISPKVIDRISNCPNRVKLTQLILDGSSAVFLLLESGDSKKDKAANLLLKNTLKELNSKIKLPDKVIAAGAKRKAEDEINQLKSSVPFKIDLTLLSIPKPIQKKGEVEILRNCLLGLESDLNELQEDPMVFVIYGRGRALPPLIGKGINEKMINQIAFYITGACSCQVKTQNPGTDLLIQKDWDTAILGKEKK